MLDWQAASTGTVENTGLLLSSRLDAWGIVDDGDSEVAVMIWAEPGGLPIATLLIKDIPETGWVAWNVHNGASYGGVGGTKTGETDAPTYSDPDAPEHCGSGGGMNEVFSGVMKACDPHIPPFALRVLQVDLACQIESLVHSLELILVDRSSERECVWACVRTSG